MIPRSAPILLAAVLIVGCQAASPLIQEPTAEPEPTSAPEPTAAPTSTPTPTPTPTDEPEPTEAPTEEPEPTEAPAQGITAANASEIGVVTVLSPPGGQSTTVTAVAYSPVEEVVASYGWSSEVNLWDVDAGEVDVRMSGHTTYGLGLEFSPDGTRLVSGGFDFRVYLWNVDTGQDLFDTTTNALVRRTRFSPDGSQIVAAGAVSSRGLVIDAVTGETTELRPSSAALGSAAISAEYIAIADLDGVIYIYDAERLTIIEELQVPRSLAPVADLEFSPDGSQLTALMDQPEVYAWSTGDWSLDYTTSVAFNGPGFDAAYVPSGEAIVVVGEGPVFVLNTEDGGQLYSRDLEELVWGVSVNGGGSRFALAMDQGSVVIMGLD